ncbi:periplasmic heavy metal sensor [Segnochrobactraceae bacterium EtOH-i3]
MTIRKPWSFILLGLLAVSLLLNCAAGGFAIMRSMGPPFEPGGGRMLAGLLRPFPDPLRDEIRDRLEKDRTAPERKAVFAEMRAARQAFMSELRAPDFDRARVDAAADRLDAAVSAINRHFSAVVIDAIAAATPEVRAEIRPAPDFGPGRGGSNDDPPPGPAPGLFAPPPPPGH